ncbi:uncharacterized protein LOC115945087 [Leptonychotes weddellii]|uniref:Uncharacterized protein LOC115945087 n=1 Tax=Leptonychotes weddellii TaxID=9713 RepID=A0A7F8RXW0_LEPWE|nr:uncharacterized protein LOC115945087 [Leptonychotes weddellii]
MAGHMTPPNLKGTEKCHPATCLEGRKSNQAQTPGDAWVPRGPPAASSILKAHPSKTGPEDRRAQDGETPVQWGPESRCQETGQRHSTKAAGRKSQEKWRGFSFKSNEAAGGPLPEPTLALTGQLGARDGEPRWSSSGAFSFWDPLTCQVDDPVGVTSLNLPITSNYSLPSTAATQHPPPLSFLGGKPPSSTSASAVQEPIHTFVTYSWFEVGFLLLTTGRIVTVLLDLLDSTTPSICSARVATGFHLAVTHSMRMGEGFSLITFVQSGAD